MASINMSPPSTSLLRSKMSANFGLFNGLHSLNLLSSNGYTSEAFLHLSTRSCSKNRADSRLRASLLPVEGGFQLNDKSVNGVSTGIEMQPDLIALGTLSAKTTPSMSGFPTGADEYDLDRPTPGFSSIPEAIEDIRQGKMVVVVDDEDRENEGDLIMAASTVTPEAMAFIVRHGTGIVCVSMKSEDFERLELPLMVTHKDNEEKLCTVFTVSVHGTTTGVSARDRAATIKALASKDSKPGDFNRPGHIFPLKYREGGVLKRAGHTEASVDLAMLAGFDPVAVLCEIVDNDGSMARLPKLKEFVERENLKIISIADLIRYRRKTDKLVERASAARIPTTWGPFVACCYRSVLDGMEHIAMVKAKAFVVPRRSMMALILSSSVFSQTVGNIAFAQQFVGFREYIDTFDGYSFNYPQNWIQVRGANADIFFRDPFILDENLSVELSSPSSSKYKTVEDLGTPEEAGKAALRQYLTEFMSTRLGVRRESSILSTSSRVADDGRMYYQIEVNIKSFANNNELGVMPQDRVARMEWDRRYLSVLGVENNQLYELRLQVPENVFVEEEKDLRKVMASFRINKLAA